MGDSQSVRGECTLGTHPTYVCEFVKHDTVKHSLNQRHKLLTFAVLNKNLEQVVSVASVVVKCFEEVKVWIW